jgi:hypothetical protein
MTTIRRMEIQSPPLRTITDPAKCHRQSVVRFSPYAWAKLCFMRDLGSTEVGGFGITAADDLLRIEDVCFVRQRCTPMSVALDDAAVAALFDEQVDLGRRPDQFGRIWIHTHPGQSAEPSEVDEQTFARVFRRTDWALMFILARNGTTHARLRFNVGPGGEATARVEVDFSYPFAASDEAAWEAEYHHAVVTSSLEIQEEADMYPGRQLHALVIDTWPDDWPSEWGDELYLDLPVNPFGRSFPNEE